MSTYSNHYKIPESFTNLANALPQLVWIADPDGKVFYFNQMIKELDGATQMPDGSWIWITVLHPDDRLRTINAWQDAVQKGDIYEIEHRMHLRSGDYRWILTRAFPEKDPQGKVLKWFGTATDIHAQKTAMEQIERSEAEFRAIFEISTAGMVEADASGRMLMVNKAFSEMLGYTEEELCSLNLNDITHPDDLKTHLIKFNHLVRNAKKLVHEKRYIRKDGSVMWGFVNATPVLDEEGNFKHTIAVIQDVTDRKLIEQSIQQLATQLKLATDSAKVGIWSYNPRNNELEWSPLHYKLWGYSSDKIKLYYDDWFNPIHPEDKENVANEIKQAEISGELYDCKYRIIRPNDGLLKWIHSVGEFQYDKNKKPVSVTGISIDITDQKNKEEQLIEIKEQLELTLKNVPAGIMLINKNREVVFANERAAIFSKRKSEVDVEGSLLKDIHQTVQQHFDVYTRDGMLMNLESSPIEKAFTTHTSNEDVYRIEYKKDFPDRWIVYSCNPLLDEEGKALMVLATITDVTTQMVAEQSLRQSEEQLRFLAESIPQLVWLMNDQGECEFKNARWEEYSGINIHDPDLWTKIVHPDDLNRITRVWRKGLHSGESVKDELRLINKDGEYRWHSLTGEPIRDEEGVIKRWIGVYSDIHEQKTSAERLEMLVALRTKELQRSNEDLQQFAHVASHDMKEPLRKIKIFGSRLKDEFGDDLPEKARLYLEKIESASNRMFSMVDGVLQYSLLNASLQKTEKIDLNEVFANIRSDLEIRISQSNAKIIYPKLPIVEGSAILIYQLFFNLVNNSLKFQSGEKDPVIEINYENILIKNHRFFSIKIRDNGIGFEQEYADKIFDSFSRLNSKDSYEGTGLGLALCKKIAERHHGSIEASGSVGKGAVFTVYLPEDQYGSMI